MKWARSSMLWVYIRRSRYEMLFGVGWPWWSAQTARGEPANARPALAAVRKNSRRVGLRVLSPKFRRLAILEFRIFALVLFIILGGSLATKLLARGSRDRRGILLRMRILCIPLPEPLRLLTNFIEKVGPLYHPHSKAVKKYSAMDWSCL